MQASAKLCLAAIALGWPVVAAAKPQAIRELSHSEPWRVNYGENQCDLLGAFGQLDEQVFVRFTRYGPYASFQLAFLGNTFKSSQAYSDLTIDFGPLVNPRRVRTMNGRVGNMPVADAGSARLDDREFENPADEAVSPPISVDEESTITDLTFKFGSKAPIRIRLGSMAAPMQTLRACMDDLIKHWGFDPVEIAALTRSPTPITNPATWLGPNDYPQALLMRGGNGIIRFRTDVDAEGKVTNCRILSQTRPEGFADLTCRLITQRARFLPALDREGNPAKSFWANSVRWVTGSY